MPLGSEALLSQVLVQTHFNMTWIYMYVCNFPRSFCGIKRKSPYFLLVEYEIPEP